MVLFVGVSVGEYGSEGSGLVGDSGTAGLLTGIATGGLGLGAVAPKFGGGGLGGGTICGGTNLSCTVWSSSLNITGLGGKNSPPTKSS